MLSACSNNVRTNESDDRAVMGYGHLRNGMLFHELNGFVNGVVGHCDGCCKIGMMFATVPNSIGSRYPFSSIHLSL